MCVTRKIATYCYYFHIANNRLLFLRCRLSYVTSAIRKDQARYIRKDQTVYIPLLPLLALMANSPRVEITEKALRVLKIEAAIQGLGQKETLEALILRGASAELMPFVEVKDRQEDMEVLPEDAHCPNFPNCGSDAVVELLPKMDIATEKPKEPQLAEAAAINSDDSTGPDVSQKGVSTEARQALSFILSELEAAREPTVNEVADKMGLTTTGLGRVLSVCGIKAKNTHRDMKTVRIYTKPMKAKIEGVLETTK